MAGGLAVVDISDPAHPEAPVYCVTLGTAYDVAVSGGYAYVADYTSGLTVVDISDPANPRSGQSLDVGGTAAGVTVSGTCAYVATWEVGLVSVDISDPENPSILDAGCGTTTDLANDACVAGGYAFFVYDMDPAFGLAIADATDPAVLGSPVYLTLPGGEHNKITVVGRYALVADGNAGLTVIELWNGNE